MRFLIVFLCLVVISQVAVASPVIYQGGQMIDTAFDSKSTDIQWAYSVTSHMAVGYRYFQSVSESTPLHMAQANWLLNRWNEENSQANIYGMTGIGVQGQTLAPYIGAEADWESREFYVAALAEQFWMQIPSNKVTLRVGMAPYVAEYDGLHTWLILQAVQLNTGAESAQWMMPVIRLFKDNVLTEFGSNGVIHYASLRIHF